MASFKFGQLARGFSTSVVRDQLVKAPLAVHGIEGRYAHAVYSAATKEKKLDTVAKELSSFQKLLTTDTQLAAFITNPSLNKNVKTDGIASVMKKQSYSSVTTNLFAALAENGRLAKTSGVLTTFNKIMSAHRGEVMCSLTTAKPLDPRDRKELETALTGFLKKGQTLQLEVKVDPTILGGMVVTIGDRLLDMSVSTKMKTYSDILKQSI